MTSHSKWIRLAVAGVLLAAVLPVSAALVPAVLSGVQQTVTPVCLAEDHFDRADTAWQTNTTGPNSIGMYSNDWSITAQSWKLSSCQVVMQRNGGSGLLVWQPDGTSNTNGRNFELQADFTLNTMANTDWIGLAFNVQDATNYYVLRYSGEGNIQFQRIQNNVSTALYAGNFTNAAGYPYRMTVASGQAQTFDWALTDAMTGSNLLSGAVRDTGTGFSGGQGGIYGASSAMQADNFRLQVNELLTVAKTVQGTPVLTENSTFFPQDSFSANVYNNNVTMEEFRKAGVNGINLFFARNLCVLLDTGTGSFTVDTNILDQGVENILSNNPDARIVLLTGVYPPYSWHKYYNNETYLKDINGSLKYPDPHSLIYLTAAGQYISNLVAHVEAQSYSRSIVGYQISLFDGGEWVMPVGYWGYSGATCTAFQSWLQEKYSTVENLRTAWNDPTVASFETISVPLPQEFVAADHGAFRDPALRRKVIDFETFWQDSNVSCLLAFCRTVKEASTNSIPPLTGAFYGYTLESGQAFYKGHLALRTVLDSPDIDFLAAPYSYIYRCPAWQQATNADISAGAYHGPADSIIANGKLFFSEDDSRTYLTTNDSNCHFPDLAGTVADLRRNQLVNLCHGTGFWRLDLYGGGWYNSTDLMQEIGLEKHLDNLLVSDTDYASGYTPDVALIVDEASPLYVASVNATNADPRLSVNRYLRDNLCRGGVNYGVYLLSDLVAGRVPDGAVYLFAGTYRITRSDRNWIDENLKKNGKTLVWFYGSGLYDETGWGLNRIRDLTGLDIEESTNTSPSGIEPASLLTDVLSTNSLAWDTTAISGQPEWYVQNVNSNATVIGNYVHGSVRRPAMVLEDKGDWTTVYTGSLLLDPEWVLGLMRLIGVHQVLKTDATVPVYAGHGIIGIWPTTNMTGTVQLKENSDVYDLYTGQLLYQSVTNFPVNLSPWQVSGFKTEPAGTPWMSGRFYQWQTGHFQSSEITAGLSDGEVDADGDGIRNYNEFIAGTDPRNPLSKFTLQMNSLSSWPAESLTFNSAAGRVYTLYARTNLLSGAWQPLSTSFGTGTGVTVTATNTAPSVFYRISVQFP